MGLVHPMAYDVNFAEEVFKGTFSFEEVLNRLLYEPRNVA